jgi:hypothetical protein
MFRSKSLLTLSVLGLAGVGVSIALASPQAGKLHTHSDGLGPQNIAALRSAATALATVPTGVHAPSPSDRPSAGTVHTLGNGKAYAWARNGETCWSAGASYGVAACAIQTSGFDFDALIHDPDALSSGQPAHVSGIAADDVQRVVATLTDGSTFTAVPTANWYDIALPADVSMDQVTEVTATLSDGLAQTILTAQ